jgi:signal transduction histidine kinase
MRLALLREPQAFQQNQLVSREAVVQLADFDVLGRNPSLSHRSLRRPLGHVVAHKVHRAAGEQSRRVGHELLAGDQDRLVAQVRLAVEEFLRDDDCGSCSVAGRAALQFRQGVVDHGRVGDFLQRVLLLELGVGVALRVLVADSCDFCLFARSADCCDHELSDTSILTSEVFRFGAVSA